MDHPENKVLKKSRIHKRFLDKIVILGLQKKFMEINLHKLMEEFGLIKIVLSSLITVSLRIL